MEYAIVFKPEWNIGNQVAYILNLTNDQLKGIISFIQLYSYDKYIDKQGTFPASPDTFSIYATIGSEPGHMGTIVKTIDLETIEGQSDLIGGHTYNDEMKQYVTLNRPNESVYELIYRVAQSGYPGNIPDVKLPTQEIFNKYIGRIVKSRYIAIFESKYDLAFKQFDNVEYLQGFMSMAKWLGEDYAQYIRYIFDGPNRVVINN